MRKFISTIIMSVLCANALAQERTVQNKPYIDLRTFHFGVLVGTHLQDLEFVNVGPQTITYEDGTTAEKLITCDQDRWEPGFTVGVLGELRLHENFAFRVAPAMYFGTRHLTFQNLTEMQETGDEKTETQEMKTAYISSACELIFAAPRFNNNRPYLLAGINPMINLSGRTNSILKLKGFDCFLEVGMGCDFYLPFFKFRSELKFMYGLTNNLDTDHANHIKDKNLLMYTNSVKESRSKMVCLTFYFE